MNFFNKTFLITGGTGSFGKVFTKKLIKLGAKKIIIFSRDELKQFEMRNEIKSNKIEYVIGDVRIPSSMSYVFDKVDCVFHAAALKQVPSNEFFPLEAINTNTIGTENVLNACIQANVKKFVLLSTDKAVYPINVMGQSKALAEKIAIAKSRIINPKKLTICITRYGNVLGSRGSVIPYFIELLNKRKPLTITDENMSRFIMSLEDAVSLVSYVFQHGKNGSIYVKKCNSVKIKNIALSLNKIFNQKLPIVLIGKRVGEKKHEILISEEEISNTISKKNFFQINMSVPDLNYKKFFYEGEKVKYFKPYSSDNVKILSFLQTLKIIKKYLNKNAK